MMNTATIPLSFADFLAIYPKGTGFYELVDGKVVEMEATRAHKNVARFLVKAFDRQIENLQLDLLVDKDVVIRTVTKDGLFQGRNPDVSVVSASVWNSNVTAYGALTEAIALAVEVVSTNWEDDYVDKFDEYQRLGIAEYWIVDYLAIASRFYLGNPKQASVFVYRLVDGEYQGQRFTGGDLIISGIFRQLNITVEEIVAASQIKKV